MVEFDNDKRNNYFEIGAVTHLTKIFESPSLMKN